MADPFDVQLPAQMRLPPVDMSGMKYVGRNVASWFQGDPEMEMRKARLNLEFEQVRSQIATQQMDNRVKQHMLQEKTQADLWTAEMLAESRYDPNAILKYVPPPEKASNPGFSRNVMNLKNQASLTLAREARTNQEIDWNSELARAMRSGDKEFAIKAGTLFRKVNREQWSEQNVAELMAITGALNEREAAAKAKTSEKTFVPTREGKWLREAEELEAEGKTELAKDFRALISKAAKEKEVLPVKTVTVTEQDPTTGRKMTRKMTESEAANEPPVLDKETQKLLKQYAEEKAALQSGDKSVGPDWIGLRDRARKLSELDTKIKQKGIDPETGRKISSSPAKQTAPEAATSPKRPTKAIAADYVQRLGREKAIEALRQEGYDLSGYAD